MVERKLVVVPKDKEAEVALDYAQATDEQLLQLTFSDDEFNELYVGGFFDSINEIAVSLIDEFESEAITEKEKLQRVLNSDVFNMSLVPEKLQRLKTLFQEALQRNTGVYFYF